MPSRPRAIAASSSALSKPILASMAAWAQEPANILPPQLAVEPDGGVDVLHDDRGPAGEAAAPLHVGGLFGVGRSCRSRGGFQLEIASPDSAGGGRRHPSGGGVGAQTACRGRPALDRRGAEAGVGRPSRFPTARSSTRAAPHRLADFKGRGMVVNLWATWCAPCVAEMPSLEALSKALAPHDIAVLPLSSDRGGADASRRGSTATVSVACRSCSTRKAHSAALSAPAAFPPRSSSTPQACSSLGLRAPRTGPRLTRRSSCRH